ncbi:EF-P 5-aminopentanol modification-associated protein YfmH [Holdemanella biformis]|uniref:EF-P 5-aminopentanol modification-associated protein YfmH n=1 Tax=Holdemanella biformis TaxID=1735 RepID=UPI002E771FDE|nr:pitrilysin family protein [Holdemanella biformis]MEE0396194.1 pitrilysin family protein [Holdemanella biformis]
MNYNLDLTKETLPNGLQVLLVHKPDYQRSLFLLGAKVGGFDIDQNVDGTLVHHKSGLAHYLEHQMFYLDGEDVSELFAGLQCLTNAYTSYTETAFYFSTTADVKQPLKLLFDFVENLDVTNKTIEKEKGIILSEYDMYQQSPEQRLFKETLISLYKNHPMKVDVLGSKEDIQNMRMEDLKYFYELNYDPSKLCLVGITGKDTDEIMEWIKDCQKDVESKCDKEISRVFKEEPMEVNRKEFVDTMDISQPFVCVGFKMKPCSNVMESIEKDFAVNMWLDSLMGPLNPKFQEWLDQRIFTQFVGAEADFTIDHSYVLFYAQTTNPDAFIELVKEQVKKKTILNEDYQSLRAQAIANNLRGLNHFDGLANDLLRSHFENFDYIDSLNRIQKMSLDKILSNLGDLDFSNVCVTKILPNDSI